MTNPANNSDHKTTCVARRHLEASLYVTYDAMLATAKAGRKKRIAEGKPPGDLIFSGTMATLANKTNRSRRTEN